MGDQGVHVIDLIRWSFGESARVVVNAGVAYPERSAPGVNGPADTDDYGTVLAELASGGQVTFSVSRVAHATIDQSLEVWGTEGALRYRLVRDGPRWFEGELYASRGALVRRRAPRPGRARRGARIAATRRMGQRGRVTSHQIR